jgi:hypothetical protein
MASLDTGALINSIKDVASGVVQQDVTTISGFAQDQLKELAQQAETIAAMQVAGVFEGNDELRDHFTSQLEAMTKNFARTLQGLAIITVEKLINAVLDVITKAIGTATGIALPLPGKI